MDRSAVNQAITDNIRENIAVKQEILNRMIPPVAQAAEKLVDCLRGGGKLLLCGNGGSAADAQHLAAELVVRLRSAVERPALPALALTVDSSILTAGGNDYGFNQVFSRQIEALGHPGDVLIAISTSGNSPNVIAAVEAARRKDLFVIGFLGGSGGKLAAQVDLPLTVPSHTTARIQESHILIGHILCLLVEELLFEKPV